MITFNDLMTNLNDMVKHSGFTHTANAISMLFENDQITQSECYALRTELANRAFRYAGKKFARKLFGCERVEVNEIAYRCEAHEASMNRYRLENNQLTEWIDLPLVNLPQPQLEVGLHVSYYADNSGKHMHW